VSTKVLVTGAGGFIGSHVAERLVREGFRVRAFVHYNSANYWHHLERVEPDIRREVEVFSGDIADPFAVDEAVRGCEIVFHLAALVAIPYSYLAPAAYVSANVTGTLNVLQACRRHRVARLLHTSTSEVYGTAQRVPIDEAHPLVGQSPYSASKIAADQLAESFWRSFKLPLTIVRPFNTYGPRQSARAVIPTIICQALANRTIRLGSLAPVRDFTYVEDTAAGFLAAAGSNAVLGETINLGVGRGVTIGELVAIIGNLLGRELPVQTDDQRLRPPDSEVMRLISNNDKCRRLTGWAPTVPLETGLAKAIDYVRAHPDDYKPDIYSV
jgi:NAD dependent epimerase/dehydratase